MTKDEFGRRVKASQNKLYRIARSYLSSEHDCLDAVSEAILKAWQKQSSLHDEQLFETWLVRILVRECINIQRKKKRVVPMETLPEEEAAPTGANAELRHALDQLPQEQRVVVVMHYMEGYGVNEIAKILHTFKGTVTSRLYYARLKLRDLLKEDFE